MSPISNGLSAGTALLQAQTYALSGLKVIQATDNSIGTLLDIRI